jgi:hypothetical protein
VEGLVFGDVVVAPWVAECRSAKAGGAAVIEAVAAATVITAAA